jgi:iron complex outermembrane receptor protein
MFRQQQVSRAIAVLIAGIAGAAVAQQQQPAQTGSSQSLQRVEITGSNIKRIDAESVAPVEVITREQIQRSGQPTIADVLRNLPSNSGGSFGESFTNSFAPGAAGISLRGLGQKTTLVLINSRRVTGYGFAQNLQDSFVDLNSIPSSAVERVEILRDGASAIYGSDAIAGVVNIILRKDFRGVEATAGYGRSHGVPSYEATLTGGFGDLGSNKFNVFGVLDLYKRDLTKMSDIRDRDYRGEEGGGRNFASLTGGGTWQRFGGTGVANEVYQATASCPGTVLTGPQAVEAGLINLSTNQSAATLALLNARAAATNTFCSKDFNDQFTALPETQRIGFLGRATYELSPTTQLYAEIGLSRNETFQTFQAPFFAGTTGLQQTPAGLRPFPYNINFAPGVAGNPFPVNARYVGVLQDQGTRNNDISSDTGRLLVGATYSLRNWDLDSAIGYSRNRVESLNENRITLSGTSAVFGVPTTPQPPVPTSTSSAYNLNDQTLNSQAIRDSFNIDFPRTSTSSLFMADTRASTEFANVRLPGGPLGLAVGVEYRRERLNDVPDVNAQSGNVLGQGITATSGKRTSEAAFAELRLPILRQLEAQIAGRYDHYSDFGNSFVPKYGLKWTPAPQLAFRANWGRGFRAPTLPEISDSVATFFTTVIDPQDGVSRQISGVFAGNPSLKAEKSKSTNIGIIFEPMRDASISVDYYRIVWKNIVASESFQSIVNQSCPNGPPCPDSPSVIRDPSNNNVIVTVLSNYQNLSETTTSGFDIDLRYAVPTATWGKFGTRLNLVYVKSFKEEGVEYVGTNGGTNTIPRMKYKASLDWDIGAWRSTASVNYIKGWRQDLLAATFFNPALDPRFQSGTYPVKTPSYATLDLYSSYQLTRNWRVSANVLNVFDRLPPYDPGFSSTSLYDFSQFDPRGRQYRVNLSYTM